MELSPAKFDGRHLGDTLAWWVITAECWTYEKLLAWFIETCWDDDLSCYAKILLLQQKTKAHAVQAL